MTFSWTDVDGLRTYTHCGICDSDTAKEGNAHVCTPLCDKCGNRHDIDDNCGTD